MTSIGPWVHWTARSCRPLREILQDSFQARTTFACGVSGGLGRIYGEGRYLAERGAGDVALLLPGGAVGAWWGVSAEGGEGGGRAYDVCAVDVEDAVGLGVLLEGGLVGGDAFEDLGVGDEEYRARGGEGRGGEDEAARAEVRLELLAEGADLAPLRVREEEAEVVRRVDGDDGAAGAGRTRSAWRRGARVRQTLRRGSR